MLFDVWQEGGGRRGLPRSFLNRFTRVHIAAMQAEDLTFIAGKLMEGAPGACAANIYISLSGLVLQVLSQRQSGSCLSICVVTVQRPLFAIRDRHVAKDQVSAWLFRIKRLGFSNTARVSLLVTQSSIEHM